MCIGQLFLTSADSESFAYLVKLLFTLLLLHPVGYVFACAHTFVYVVLLIENGVDCAIENCRPNNVDHEEKEGKSDRNTR